MKLRKALKTLAIIIILITLGIYLFMQQKTFGKLPLGKRLERIKKSPNYKEDNFQNLSETPQLAENTSYFTVMRHALKKRKNTTPDFVLPTVKTDLHTVVSDKPVITWFGHSSYLIQANGKNILVDPVFSERASFSQYIGPKAYPGVSVYSVNDMPEIDVLILTHDHYDHLDYHTILQLKPKVKHYYTSLGVGSHLEFWGVNENDITELDWWESAKINPDMVLTATPARHFSGRGFTRNKTIWSSFVLKIPNYNIFVGGDSGYDTHFKEIGEKFGPFDLVILECGQYDNYWPYIHMTPEQTAQASIDLKGKVLLPVHWGKFSLAVHDWNESPNRVSKKAEDLGVKLTTPMIGEKVVLDSIYPNKKWWNIEK